MKRAFSWLAVGATIVVAACQPETSKTWFDGDLGTALAAAEARDTQVMIEFYAEWCNWCRRLETDTFSVPEVRSELQALVSMKLDAEKEGAELADRFEVDSYPTLIFLDSNGNEMDRILGYLPPNAFLRRVQRIRKGDTFLACLRQLEEDPGNIDAIERSVRGLLERSDPEGAISRIEAFHKANDGQELDLCRRLMFASRAELHARVYHRAAKLYRRGWDRGFDVPDTSGTAKLHRLVAEGLSSLPADEQADLLREAKFEDAGEILRIPNLESASAADLLDVAGFAFSNGHFEHSAELYIRWYDLQGKSAEPGHKTDIAWKLYLAGRELERAIEIAQDSFAQKADPETADTLARLLYVSGSVEEAVALERRAAEGTEGPRKENYLGVASRMEAGESLDDRPTFESYPGKRRRVL
jgi:thioredoxin-related protein